MFYGFDTSGFSGRFKNPRNKHTGYQVAAQSALLSILGKKCSVLARIFNEIQERQSDKPC